MVPIKSGMWDTMKVLNCFFICFIFSATSAYAQQVNTQDSPRLLLIHQTGKCGYIDRTGNIVIDPQFDTAGDFSEGRALVEVDEKRGYIDRTGKYVREPTE